MEEKKNLFLLLGSANILSYVLIDFFKSSLGIHSETYNIIYAILFMVFSLFIALGLGFIFVSVGKNNKRW